MESGQEVGRRDWGCRETRKYANIFFFTSFSYHCLIACDHALSLYLCNMFSGGGHDTFLSQITCKKPRIWISCWLDRKQYGWLTLFQLAKMPQSVSCRWFQSAFLFAQGAVNTRHTRVRDEISDGSAFLEFEECSKSKFEPLKYFPSHPILKSCSQIYSPIIWMQFDTG